MAENGRSSLTSGSSSPSLSGDCHYGDRLFHHDDTWCKTLLVDLSCCPWNLIRLGIFFLFFIQSSCFSPSSKLILKRSSIAHGRISRLGDMGVTLGIMCGGHKGMYNTYYVYWCICMYTHYMGCIYMYLGMCICIMYIVNG